MYSPWGSKFTSIYRATPSFTVENITKESQKIIQIITKMKTICFILNKAKLIDIMLYFS